MCIIDCWPSHSALLLKKESASRPHQQHPSKPHFYHLFLRLIECLWYHRYFRFTVTLYRLYDHITFALLSRDVRPSVSVWRDLWAAMRRLLWPTNIHRASQQFIVLRPTTHACCHATRTHAHAHTAHSWHRKVKTADMYIAHLARSLSYLE